MRADVGLFLLTVGCLAATGAGCSPTHADPGSVATAETGSPAATPRHSVEIRRPPLPQSVLTDATNPQGESVRLRCAACHSLRSPNAATAESADLDEFHQGLTMAHGGLTCGSCHQPGDGYSTLKLADGRSLPFEESMTLCAQCHGTQFRDYQHGSHGGMAGHWDLTRGGRTRGRSERRILRRVGVVTVQAMIAGPSSAGPHDRFPPVGAGGSHE